jgi:hypothetical protein
MRWSFYLTGLTLSNHERQVHVVRGRRAAERPPHPDLKPDNQSCQGEGAGDDFDIRYAHPCDARCRDAAVVITVSAIRSINGLR